MLLTNTFQNALLPYKWRQEAGSANRGRDNVMPFQNLFSHKGSARHAVCY